MRALPYFVVYVLPPCFVLGVAWGGPWLWLTPAVVFLLIPAIDAVLGHDTAEPDGTEARNPLFDLALRLWLPTQLAMIGLGLWRVGQGVTLAEGIGLAVSLGMLTGGGGINVAHELMHRRSKVDRAIAEVLMASVTYTWFCVEHVLGHHRHVATPADSASARLGESVYAFFPRTIVGGLASAWVLEGERTRRRGIGALSLQNRRLRYALGLLAIYGAVAAAVGPAGVLFFAGQSLVAVLLLECVNYVEHYGLERQQVGGRLERVQPHHSWNTTFRFTNWFLFNLQRHADHHAWAARPYHQLRPCTEAPQLPLGYPAMILMALVPPLYLRVMGPLVAEARARAPSMAASGADALGLDPVVGLAELHPPA